MTRTRHTITDLERIHQISDIDRIRDGSVTSVGQVNAIVPNIQVLQGLRRSYLSYKNKPEDMRLFHSKIRKAFPTNTTSGKYLTPSALFLRRKNKGLSTSHCPWNVKLSSYEYTLEWQDNEHRRQPVDHEAY